MRNGTDSGRRWTIVAAIATLALAATLAVCGSASAKTIYTWKYSGLSFDASSAVAPEPFTEDYRGLRQLRIDQAANVLYAARSSQEVFGQASDDRIYKFDFNGQPVPFAAFEPNTAITYTHANYQWAVDNSGGPTQGRFYALNTYPPGANGIHGFKPNGEPLGGNFPLEINVANTCGIAVDPQGDIWVTRFVSTIGFDEPTGTFEEYNPNGEKTGNVIYTETTTTGSENFPCELDIDSKGNFWYLTQETPRPESGLYYHGGVAKYLPDGTRVRGAIAPMSGGGPEREKIATDPTTGEFFVTEGGQVQVYDEEGGFESEWGPEPGDPEIGFRPPGMTVDGDSHAVYTSNGSKISKWIRTEPVEVPTAKTTSVDVGPTSATLHGVLNGDGINTTECYFQWGDSFPTELTNRYNHFTPCVEGNVFTGGSGDHAVHAEITGLTKGVEYHFRLVVKNANGTGYGRNSAFKASTPPTVSNVTAANVDTGGAHLTAEVLPNGAYTHFKFEYGTESGKYTASFPLHPPANADYDFNSTEPKPIDIPLSGLQAQTMYFFRLVAWNDAGTTSSTEQKFTTFAKDPTSDECANAHVRQQTGTRLLLDCRAYELVSASNAGGYNVESDLTVGEYPLSTSPLVNGRALYSLHYGSIPGVAGNPTDFGHDPYLAVRGSDGWTTQYVGLPANGMADPDPYGSPLLGMDGAMNEFAFGGENICEPCFSDGSINIPLRRGSTIEKGMRGSNEPAGNPSGTVLEPFSRDGTHFVFQSKAIFEPGGQASGSIYDRKLSAGGTQVISWKPDGTTPLPGPLGELDISSDGSRIVVGTQVGTDAKGNALWHPYMHLGSSPNTVDLAPGTSGVLYAGMSADGTRVFFRTFDKLIGADTDNSADLYEAFVAGGGPVSLSLVSVKGLSTPSNSDACNPTGNWNVASGGPNCSALAFAGGAGVADNGTIYFLSPEQLDGGKGEANQANLYVRRPGQPTTFVATIDGSPTIDDPAVVHALSQAATHSYRDFQVSTDGHYAIFSAQRSLNGYPYGGHYLLWRYNAEGGGAIDCASCPVTGITATADTTPPPYGLGLSNDGRVFFSTTEQLLLKDTNKKSDAYEWEMTASGPKQGLISNGVSPLDSHLLGITADGVDAFFFTHEVLTTLDENGNTVKLYDARENGGFPYLPAEKACSASDECHGPGTESPPPPNINSGVGGGPGSGNAKPAARCRKGFVRRHGKCVKRKRHHRRHHRGAHHG